MTDKHQYNIFDPAEIPCFEISDKSMLVKEPLVSIKMTTYNHASQIAQAIEGVLQQETNFPFELVIGEDCSTDGTRDIVLEYQKKHPDIIRVITSNRNVGAKKNGFRIEKACRGKYVAFCEGDDYWYHMQKLQKQVDYLESHPESGLVHSGADVCDVKTGKKIQYVDHIQKKTNNQSNGNMFLAILNKQCLILTCTVCVNRELLIRVIEADPIVFRGDRFMLGDLPRWLELSRLTGFGYIDESLATYNIMQESASHSKDKKKWNIFHLSCFDLRLYYIRKYGVPVRQCKQVINYYTDSLLKYAFLNHDVEIALKTKQMYPNMNFTQRALYSVTLSSSLNSVLRPLALFCRRIYHCAKRICRRVN